MAKKNPLIASFHYTNGSSWTICNCLHEQQKSGTWSARTLGRWTEPKRALNSGHKHQQQQPPSFGGIFYVNRKTTHLSRRVFFIQHILDWVPIKLPDDTIRSLVFAFEQTQNKRHNHVQNVMRSLLLMTVMMMIYMKREENEHRGWIEKRKKQHQVEPLMRIMMSPMNQVNQIPLDFRSATEKRQPNCLSHSRLLT